MHKITVSLGNVSQAIKELEDYKKKVRENVKEMLQQLLDEGVEIAKAKIVELNAQETNELFESLQSSLLYKEGNKGIIFTDCSYACYVEFGTGVKGATKPHPILPWAYDVNGHGEDGWYYYDAKQDRIRFTKGMPSRPFMYETTKELENRVVDVAKEVFSR